ncbi:MAG: hypothetical protein CMD35_02825, partial [Flavobacteriales bacterium]|nr:hypothetical protein [Flavobacteriales bacterium]
MEKIKKMKHKILLLTLFASLGVTHVNAQLRKWVLPYQNNDPNQTVVPIIDFTNGTAEFGTSPLSNYYSTQTVGNGEYCNNCPDESKISELIITGRLNQKYNNTSRNFNSLMVSYEQIGVCIGDFSEYIEGTDRNYAVDDIVYRNGKYYRVKVPWYTNRSNIDWAYAPGTGDAWEAAWDELPSNFKQEILKDPNLEDYEDDVAHES